MNPLMYSTILAEIQAILSDSDWDWDDPPWSHLWIDQHSQAESLVRQNSSLKPTLRIFTQVCKQWRESTLARPSCWVTKLQLVIGGHNLNEQGFKQSLSRAEKMLDGALAPQSSDIDFRAVLPDLRHFSPKRFQEFVGWMERYIFSACDRIRKYELEMWDVEPKGTNQPQVLFDRFMTRTWPRLQVLRLPRFSGESGMEVSGYLPTPKLHSAEFGAGISWKNLPFPFPRNGVSVLDVNYTFKTEPGPDAHIPELPTFMSASPPILLTSLSRLRLCLRS
jgi:hypothetical protein